MNTLKEETEQFEELPENELKIISQHTTKYCFTQTSPSPPSLDFQACIPSSTDTSFELSMHLQNIQSIRVAADRFLEQCLLGEYNKDEGFKDSSLYKVKKLDFKEQNELQNIITHNQLLTQQMIKYLLSILEKEDGMIGLLKEVPKNFGLTVAKEIVYVIYHILQSKFKEFKNITQSKESIIPKLPCFQQCQEEFMCQLPTSCPVYEDISLEETISFAEKDIQSCAHQIYFGDIKILNLKEVTCQCKKSVNILDKFIKLVTQISRATFLTLIGATQQPQGTYGLELSRQISLADLSECGLSNQRSFSRRLVNYQDEQSYDFISKKIKFD